MIGSPAPVEGDLELPWKPLTEGMGKKRREERLRVRRHVEDLAGRDPREGANDDVAHRVAARFPRGKPRLRKKGERAFDAPHLHPVDMDVLPGGQVDSSAGRVPIGRLRKGAKLLRGNPSEWNADAAEFVRRDRSGAERLHRIRDPGDFRCGDRVHRFRIVLHMTGNPSSVAAWETGPSRNRTTRFPSDPLRNVMPSPYPNASREILSSWSAVQSRIATFSPSPRRATNPGDTSNSTGPASCDRSLNFPSVSFIIRA